MVHIQTLNAERLREAAEVLASAYEHEPIIGRMIPTDAADRPRKIADFFAWSLLSTGLENIDVAHDPEDDAIVGVAIWEPPHHEPRDADGALAVVMAGIGDAGWEALQLFDGASVGKHPEGAWHLVDIGTAPRARGTGAGSTLLRHRLAKIDARDETASLEATTEAAAQIYERFGFVRKFELSGVAEGVTVMWREGALRG